MRLIFAGTPDFSVPALQALIDDGHEIIAVYTQPDRKTGRGQKILHSPVKQLALENNLSVYQPTSLKTIESQTQITSLSADVMIVVAYGMLLPKEILEAPSYGCLNIHASLLPRWRGAAPIQRAIQMGDNETGICIMQMDVGLDTGDILFESRLKIAASDTSQSLHDKLSHKGAEALITTLNDLQNKQANAYPQHDKSTTYAEKISKAEGRIDWSNSAQNIDCQIRAFNPWPVSETTFKGQRIRIWMSQLSQNSSNTLEKKSPGEIISITDNFIEVACGNGSIQLTTLQRDGSKPLPAKEFVNGVEGLTKDAINSNHLVFGDQ